MWYCCFFILNHIDKKSKEKLPKELFDFLDSKRDKNYKVELDLRNPIYDQNLDVGTVELLSEIYQNYLCSSEEKMKFIREKYNENKNINNNEVYDIFKNKKDIISNVDTNNNGKKVNCGELILNQKETFFQKIIRKLRETLRKSITKKWFVNVLTKVFDTFILE